MALLGSYLGLLDNHAYQPYGLVRKAILWMRGVHEMNDAHGGIRALARRD